MKTKTLLISSFLLMSLVFLPAVSQAQENNLQKEDQFILVATVNIYDSKIISQDKNKISVSFDLSNRENAQPGVKYAINLVRKESEEKRILVDMKVYDEVLFLSENTTIKKEIAYQAPEYLSGTYEVWVISQNEKGFLFGQNMAGEITLFGNNEYISLESCYLSIQGEAENKKYNTMQGVAVKPEEIILANCDVKNNFKVEQVAIPTFTTYYRNVFGEKIKEDKQEAIVFKPGESKIITFPIPKAQKPQAYDVVLSLNDVQEKIVSEKIPFHYVLGGVSATIQNLRLDKDYYAKDDTAKISFFATFSASNFPGSRLESSVEEKVNMEISLSSKGKECADIIKRQLDKSEQIELETSISKECLDLEALVVLRDQNGNILDQANLRLTNQKTEVATPEKVVVPVKSKLSTIIFLAFILISVISILAVLIKKRKTGTLKSFLILFAFGALIMFGGGEEAKGDTFTNGPVTISYGIDKSSYFGYSLGDPVIASGSASLTNCGNSASGFVSYMSASLNGGISKYIFNDSGTIAISDSVYSSGSANLGNISELCIQSVSFRIYMAISPTIYVNASPSFNSIYRKGCELIIFPPTTLNLSLVASPTTINSGQSSNISWSATNATSCQATGGWTSSTAVSGSQSVSPTANTTYIMTCYNSSGQSVTRSIVVSISGSSNSSPTAIIDSPSISSQTVNVGDSVTFSGSGTDTDGTVNGYSWRLGSCDGTELSPTQSFSDTFDTVGTYTIYLVTIDDDGALSTNCPYRTITVVPASLPVCVQCNEANRANVCVGSTFNSCSGPCEGTKDCDSSWQEVLP